MDFVVCYYPAATPTRQYNGDCAGSRDSVHRKSFIVSERHERSAIDYNLLRIDEVTYETHEERRVTSGGSYLIRPNIFKVKRKISEYE